MAKILVVDDEATIRDMLAFKLRNAGHEVSLAIDGGEAMQHAGRDRPDLIVLDVMMPVLGGFEVLHRLKADPELKATPVVMLTAKGQERDILTGLNGGASDYLVKPFSLRELIARIEAALRKG
jgi:two-component system alkaline phosphatase synthesis response regulator PhoP